MKLGLPEVLGPSLPTYSPGALRKTLALSTDWPTEREGADHSSLFQVPMTKGLWGALTNRNASPLSSRRLPVSPN